MPEKKTTVILWRHYYNNMDMRTRGEHRLGTSRMSIVMFAGKSAKC